MVDTYTSAKRAEIVNDAIFHTRECLCCASEPVTRTTVNTESSESTAYTLIINDVDMYLSYKLQ